MLAEMGLTHVLEELVAPQRDFGIDITVEITDSVGPEPVTLRNPAIIYGLGNYLENAVDFARKQVRVTAFWNETT